VFTALFITFDLSDVWARLEIHSYMHLGMALCVFLLLLMNNALRWNVVLYAVNHPISFYFTLKLQYIASFFNQALPSVIGGDAMRMYMSHQAGMPLQTSVNSVVLERMAALAGLIFLVTGLQFFILPQADVTYVQYIFPALSVIAVGGILMIMVLDRLPARLHHWKIIVAFSKMAKDTKRLFLSPRYGAMVMALSVTGNLLMSTIALFGAKALGIDLLTIDALVLIPPAILVSALPISIAGWGVRESAMVVSLTYAGVTEVDAIVVSIMFGVIMVVSSMPGGILWIINKSRKDIV